MTRISAVVAAFVAFVGALLPAGPAVSDGGRGDGVRLRVMTYNIHAGIGQDGVFDLDRQVATIRRQRPDVVALQEVDVHWSARSDYADVATRLARRLRMRVFFAPIYTLDPDRPGAPDRRFGLAVLSRHPILRATNHWITRLSSLVPDPVPEPMPGFPEVVINVRGVPVRVYDTHLDFRGDPSVRKAQVADMLAIMKSRRVILAGDFNAEPGDEELQPLWEILDDAGPGEPTFPAETPVKTIDYVTFTSDIRVRAAWVPATLASDHLPVVADLTIPRR